ncbi:NUDIX hydrolase [Brucella rhizosphaerae]|uniref:NUDIX domain protein n=1 Tax=Brucella rhizosphaerae TaxID=571254 RepID=A0A256FDF1_9HYPH|nr:NUDIX domain-containing protein [Brucella rhizosphaerae]OYR12823.1 NUDIX domain protein [Brucella rhizosphaerae]
MTTSNKAIDKVLIYATWNSNLLVFCEPENPDVPLQVPGGTVDEGETMQAAAYREFHEETGILRAIGMNYLETVKYEYIVPTQTETHIRHSFHLPLNGRFPNQWHHYEMFPCDGNKPILFELFWLPLEEARARIGLGMGKSITKIGL